MSGHSARCAAWAFVYEGFLRCGIEGSRDALMFGMLRHECRFLIRPRLNRYPTNGGPHGILTQAA